MRLTPLFPVNRSQRPVFPAIVSQLFPHRDHLYICGHQNSASALETNDNRSISNSPYVITINVRQSTFHPTTGHEDRERE